MAAMIGPDGKPPTFDGAAWISQDGRYWWNGAAWERIKKRRGFQPPIAVAVIVLVVVAGAWYVLQHIPSTPPTHGPYGVTNAKIDSSTQFEFDYRRAKTCKDLTFEYQFLDAARHQVGVYADEKHSQIDGDQTYHITTFVFGQAIDSHAVRFNAVPTCHA